MRGAATAIAIALLPVLSACAGPAHYSAMFNQPDGLGPGDPVIHAGETIGSVTAMTPASGGDSQASITIDPGYSKDIRIDSVMTLTGAGTSPFLEVENRDPSSAYAQENAVLYGASNAGQARLFAESLGPPTFVNRYAQFLSSMASPAPTPAPGAPPSVMTQQLQALTAQTLAAAAALAATSPQTTAQIGEYRRDAAAVESQLRSHGKTDAANQIQASVDQLNKAQAASAPPNKPNPGAPSASPPPSAAGSGAPPNTLTVPSGKPAAP